MSNKIDKKTVNKSKYDHNKGAKWLANAFLDEVGYLPPEPFESLINTDFGEDWPQQLPEDQEKLWNSFIMEKTDEAWELFHKSKGYMKKEEEERENRKDYPY